MRGRSPERPPHPLGILDEVEAGEHPEQPTAFDHAPEGVVEGAVLLRGWARKVVNGW